MSSRSISGDRGTRSFLLEANFGRMSTSTKATTARANQGTIVLGLDLSLTGTGVVVLTPTKVIHKHLPTKPINALPKSAEGQMWKGTYYGTLEDRIGWIAANVLYAWMKAKPDLTIIEEYAFSRHSRGLSGLHECGGTVKHYLWLVDALWLPVGSKTAKMHATGNGNAGKDEMIAAARRMWDCPDNDDIADAFALAHYGLRNFAELVQAA